MLSGLLFTLKQIKKNSQMYLTYMYRNLNLFKLLDQLETIQNTLATTWQPTATPQNNTLVSWLGLGIDTDLDWSWFIWF